MTPVPFPNTPEDDWNGLAPRAWSSLSDEEKLRRLRATFHHAVIGEMHRSLPCIKIGTALLAFCGLDFLGALAAGKRATGATFRAFCSTYLLGIDQRYDCDRLYSARCRLVHNYSMQGGYSIIWQQPGLPAVHLHPVSGAGTVLVLEQFITDIDAAGEALFVAASIDLPLRATMLSFATTAPPIGFGALSIQSSTLTGYP